MVEHMKTELVTEALNRALTAADPTRELIHHPRAVRGRSQAAGGRLGRPPAEAMAG
jgi:hypothetical protein